MISAPTSTMSVSVMDPVLVCPYNPSHQILRSRMQYHLVKCQRSHPRNERDICPFNATHRIQHPEIYYHISICPDRRVIEEHKYLTEDEAPKPHGLSPYHEPPLPKFEENWDDTIVETYKPSDQTVHRPILRNLQGATKSQRKKFRQDERRRVQLLASGCDIEAPTQEEMQPLRSPKSVPVNPIPQTFSNLGQGRGVPIRILQLAENAAEAGQGARAGGGGVIGRGTGRDRQL